ncbi:Stf0 family sulfotransferase [Rhodovibrionaceae bacterium A322]
MTSLHSYVICCSPRSGSTLLCYLLRQTGRAGVPESYFSDLAWYHQNLQVPSEQPGAEPAITKAYLAAIQREGRGESDCFGLRLQGHSLERARQGLQQLFPTAANDRQRLREALGVTRFIHLSRQDLAAQAVSRLKAEQSGLWHRHADGRELERLSAPLPFRYDRQRLDEIISDLEQQSNSWQRWFQAEGIEPLQVLYEDLASAPQQVFSRVLEHLGLTPEQALKLAAQTPPPTAKLADDLSKSWVARYKSETGTLV